MSWKKTLLLPLAALALTPAVAAPADVRFDGAKGAMSLASFRGRPVLVELWANWCVPCIAGLPAVEAIARDNAATGLAVVPISIDRGGLVAAARGYARAGITRLPLYAGDPLRVGAALRANGLPFALLLDAEGREVARFEGGEGRDAAVREAIARLLKADKPRKP